MTGQIPVFATVAEPIFNLEGPAIPVDDAAENDEMKIGKAFGPPDIGASGVASASGVVDRGRGVDDAPDPRAAKIRPPLPAKTGHVQVASNDTGSRYVSPRKKGQKAGRLTTGSVRRTTTPPDVDPEIMFSISVDGEHVAGTPVPDGGGRSANAALDAMNIQVKFDGLDVTPMLNVSTMPVRRSYLAGEQVTFLATANYPAFINRAEIWITAKDGEHAGRSAVVLPVAINGTAFWTMPADGPADYLYVLRVYDAQGRFDETEPLSLARTIRFNDGHEPKDAAVAPGFGEDRTARRNIPIHGGTITVYGSDVPPGYDVRIMGDEVPVDRDSAFVVQRILPAGDHSVSVQVNGGEDGGVEFDRAVNIPANDWFYVAIADATIGYRDGDAGIETVRPGEFGKVYTKGRLAFYLKGKIKGRTLLTAAADTGEGEIGSLFKGFDEKSARDLLRRLDPDDYYPVYGDDSTSVEDAPTRGKFYVRLERGDSHVMWGNYKTKISGTELMRSDRALYGASGIYRSPETTSFGERRTEVTTYAAQPGTLPHRDVFRGTGGSAYFLKYQDIVAGSETVLVEIRDGTTGALVERRRLQYGTDYDIDPIQGIIILMKPLSSITGGSDPVRDGALDGHEVYLVVQYEFTPAAGDVDGYVYGGRFQHWFGEHVRIGATGMSEKTGAADQIAYGADLQLRMSDETYLEAEFAQSDGPGFSNSFSTDGGITIDDKPASGVRGVAAKAWRLRARASLGEITNDRITGSIGGYYEEKESGFATLAEQVNIDQRIWGAHAEVDLTAKTALKLTYDDFEDASGKRKRLGSGSVTFKFDDRWQIALGVEHARLASPGTTKAGYNGRRTDIGARLEFRPDDGRLFYLFGQGTVDLSGDIHRNDRIGVGAEFRLTEKVGVTGEVSYGSTGVGALAGVTYDPTADDHYYVGYELDPDRSFSDTSSYALVGDDRGSLVVGAKRKMSDTLSAYSENNFDIFGRRRSMTQAYGVVYTPDAIWTVNGGIEMARINDSSVDPTTGLERSDFDRKAFSMSVGYNDEEAGITARVRGEARFEESTDGTRDQNTWLFAAGLEWRTMENWRLIAKMDAVLSKAKGTSFRDGNYVEASIGYAYRPTDNDRINALFKYTYLYDLPGANQVNVAGDLLGPSQRSHILSLDATFDVRPWLSIGGKYGVRVGEIRARGASAWEQSIAHLGIVRTDLHIVKHWDVLLEARVMYIPGQDTTEFGALAAIYRHFGDNFKLGVGYNFGRFSDDLRDVVFDDQGFFVNIIGKF
ncbi:MAG: TonB-dependent receptor [Rhizobiaceae bacterium]